jgi:hypothetical protein
MQELDFPVTHPASVHYTGTTPAVVSAFVDVDFPFSHPARGGANVRDIDTIDGQRAAHLKYRQDLHQLAMMGSLPPVMDPETHRPLELAPEQLALIYAVRKGLTPPLAAEVTSRYQLKAEPASAGASLPEPRSAEDLALAHIMGLGYLPERAREILAKYGVPDIVQEQLADERR